MKTEVVIQAGDRHRPRPVLGRASGCPRCLTVFGPTSIAGHRDPNDPGGLHYVTRGSSPSSRLVRPAMPPGSYSGAADALSAA